MCQALCISHIISLSHHNSSEKWVLSYMIADCPTCYVGRGCCESEEQGGTGFRLGGETSPGSEET